jgi:hypothetical protein
VAEFVSGVLKSGIRGILTKADGVTLAEGFDLGAVYAKERAVNRATAQLGNRFDASQSGCTCSAQEVKKTGLGLVIGMVGQHEVLCFGAGGALLEKGHAQLAGGEFEGFFLG